MESGEETRPGPWPALVVGLTLLAVVVLAYCFRAIFGPLLIALALAYILEPLVRALMDRRVSRPVAVVLVLLGAAVLGLSLLGWLGVEAVSLVAALSAEDGMVAQGLTRLFAWAREQNEQLPEQLHFLRDKVGELARDDFWQPLLLPALDLLRQAVMGLMSSFSVLGVLVLMPIYLCYLMLDLEKTWTFIKEHLPARGRAHTLMVLSKLHSGMSAFLRGRVILAGLKGVLTAVGLLLCGTPMAVLVGLGAGVLSILPFVGPALGFGIALALTLAGDPTLYSLLAVAAVFAVAEFLEGFVLTPWVMRKGAGLGPLAVLFCVIFWGAALGVFGALMAIPLTIVVKILVQEYVMPSVRRVAGRDPQAIPPPA